ncbi:MAG: type II toxin-antitoxin system RelE/ParE family toxin [Allosphingosinicella sp.]
MRIVLTEDADRDLDGITWYTFENFGREQAERYVAGLRVFLKELPTHRHRLQLNKEGSDRYRRAVYKSHVAFVVVQEDRLLVARILHDRMDPENYLP